MKQNLQRVWSDDASAAGALARYARLGGEGRQRRARTALKVRLALGRLRGRGGALSKRLMDIVGSLCALGLLSPLLALTWLAIRLEDGGPAIFVQQRVGRGGQLFRMYKFRSMGVDAEQRRAELLAQNESAGGLLFKMRQDPRVTRVGRVIRKLSIDELPQLVNVLAGDMSLVGPRPALPAEVARYSMAQRVRLEAKPGITCLWQIGGRSDIGIEGQAQLDLQYLRRQSALLDATIMAKTIPVVVSGKGAY